MQILNTLLIDLHAGDPATAQASCNLVRCLLAAGGVAVIQLMIEHLGPGISFTILAITCATCAPLLIVERKREAKIRRAVFEGQPGQDVPVTCRQEERTIHIAPPEVATIKS